MEGIMISLNDLAAAFGRNVGIIKAQTEGLTNEDSLIAQPGGNCLNWVLGHMAANRDEILEVLGEPPIMGEESARYKRESEPVTGAEDGILPLEALLARLDQSQERIAATLARMDESAMATEIRQGDRTTTVGKRAFFLYFHETFHVGQTELFRQLAGKNDKII
jgi:uncharacterized damage-inducible protein DinB